MDQRIVDNGDDVTDAAEVQALVALQRTFRSDSCDEYYRTACLVLLFVGLTWRLLAYALLYAQVHWAFFKLKMEAGFAKPFLHAATEGYSEILVALIQTINVVDDKKKSILARHLQTRGGEDQKTPVQIALEKGHLETVTVLVEAAKSVEGDGKETISPLRLAAKLGKWKMVRQIVGAIKAKESPEKAAEELREALKLAANHGKRDVVRVLLSKDANKITRLRLAMDMGIDAVDGPECYFVRRPEPAGPEYSDPRARERSLDPNDAVNQSRARIYHKMQEINIGMAENWKQTQGAQGTGCIPTSEEKEKAAYDVLNKSRSAESGPATAVAGGSGGDGVGGSGGGGGNDDEVDNGNEVIIATELSHVCLLASDTYFEGMPAGRYRVEWELRVLPFSNAGLEEDLVFRAQRWGEKGPHGPLLKSAMAYPEVRRKEGNGWFTYRVGGSRGLFEVGTEKDIKVRVWLEATGGAWKYGIMFREVRFVLEEGEEGGGGVVVGEGGGAGAGAEAEGGLPAAGVSEAAFLEQQRQPRAGAEEWESGDSDDQGEEEESDNENEDDEAVEEDDGEREVRSGVTASSS
ncbi:hypothetical protein GPECTOR_242g584 [Gonium pectorale]|uniref:Uncharacterized protein n=1 Tax=Gonium pectorale TaxID=33097 RepID=A0A150FWD0_GONPE|nr:hypothetical protein GPECTOR_242g584 [Gonium pectorale]|eukprot:KXZ41923.1 hypothetical protein GPECTOR_242g584 [Gonium pectorale]